MERKSLTNTERLLDMLSEVLQEVMTNRPLREMDIAITPSLAHGLLFLARHDGCPVREISCGLSMTYSAGSQLIDRLVRKRWATRSDNAQDRRLSEIHLTREGLDLARRIRARRIEGVTRVLAQMNHESRAALAEALKSFIRAAVQDEAMASQACCHCGKDHIPDCVVNEAYSARTGTPIENI